VEQSAERLGTTAGVGSKNTGNFQRHLKDETMRLHVVAILVSGIILHGCGGGTAASGPSGVNSVAAPAITTKPAQNGAVIVSLASTGAGAKIYYTVDGSAPTTSSQQYQAPFLVASNLTLKAIAAVGGVSSTAASQAFSPNIASGTLVWSDEFNYANGVPAQPDPTVWTYDTGNSGFGNNELENYCAWGSSTAPCSTANPSEFVGTDGYLHILAQQPSTGVYTSARLKSQGLFSFQYGRIEFRAMVPEAQGFWPAAWLMGNNIATVNWPNCGEMDVLERVNAAGNPDWNAGSVHGPGFTGSNIGTQFSFPSGQTAAQWHTYGMIWKPGSVSYYVDDPLQPYATFTPASLNALPGANWPFDGGQSNFIILNLAIGGDWPGKPDNTTPFPSEMLVDYVRIYAN
jgi:beta-glucanase (GH16 family)